MGDKKSKWDQLSLSQKAGLIKIYVDNGFSDIDSIREDYNKNVENFQSNDANFVQRLRDNDSKYIQNADGSVSTHKLNYATNDNGAIIYPSVQEHNGTLVDHSEDSMGGLESAIQQKDTVRTSIPFAEWYTQNYKKDYDEFFSRYNKFDGGGFINKILGLFSRKKDNTNNNQNSIDLDKRKLELIRSLDKHPRVRDNDSPTKERSQKIEDNIHQRQINLNAKRPAEDYYIPYIIDKEISVPGVGRVSTNMLDSIAVNASKAGISLADGLGLHSVETKFGANPNIILAKVTPEMTPEEKEEVKQINRSTMNTSVARNFGGIYPQFFANDHEWFQRGYDSSTKYKYLSDIESPLQHAYTMFKLGLYNPGEKGHTNKVHKEGQRLMQLPIIKNWIETSKEAQEALKKEKESKK